MSHFSENKILTPVQHGFRSKHSCESQLLTTTDEFIQNFESKTQTYVVALDFSKAFDVVPHQRLLHKLEHYGIRGTTLTVSPRINVHALIFEDAPSFRKHGHALIFEHTNILRKIHALIFELEMTLIVNK